MCIGISFGLDALGLLPEDTKTPIPTKTLLPTQTLNPTEKHTPKPSATLTITPDPTITKTHTQTIQIHQIELLELTKKVTAGADASVIIRTEPGLNCLINYITPAGNDSEAEGLDIKTADSNGICKWKWNIGPGTNPGTGIIYISVNGTTEKFSIIIE